MAKQSKLSKRSNKLSRGSRRSWKEEEKEEDSLDALDEIGPKLWDSAKSTLVIKGETYLELGTGSRWGGRNFLSPISY